MVPTLIRVRLGIAETQAASLRSASHSSIKAENSFQLRVLGVTTIREPGFGRAFFLSHSAAGLARPRARKRQRLHGRLGSEEGQPKIRYIRAWIPPESLVGRLQGFRERQQQRSSILFVLLCEANAGSGEIDIQVDLGIPVFVLGLEEELQLARARLKFLGISSRDNAANSVSRFISAGEM